MDWEPPLEITRWNFIQDKSFENMSGLPAEAWVEMFMTPLDSLKGKSVYDKIREDLGLD
tara:strand:- start:8687 stop:8863 length:177 start_codon:yes stop_codon:yes gene_type:complete